MTLHIDTIDCARDTEGSDKDWTNLILYVINYPKILQHSSELNPIRSRHQQMLPLCKQDLGMLLWAKHTEKDGEDDERDNIY